MLVLAGDIGGTKTLLALAEVDLSGSSAIPRIELQAAHRFESRAFPGLSGVCRAFEEVVGSRLPQRAGFGVAGPVKEGRSQTTNLPWVLDEHDLAHALGISRVRLVNDFGALALGLSAVAAKDLVTLNEGVRDPRGPTAVLGAGTGLGEAVTVFAGGRRRILTTEGGHASFAPRNDLEMALLRFLAARHGHVSWERLLSGEGLVNLAEGLAHITGFRLPSALVGALAEGRGPAPAVVTEQGRLGDPLCRRVVELFCSLYGAEAGNLALKVLPSGGVYVAGGIAPRILPELAQGGFREAFLNKGRMRSLLEAIPVQVVLDPAAALRGAALLAAQEDLP